MTDTCAFVFLSFFHDASTVTVKLLAEILVMAITA